MVQCRNPICGNELGDVPTREWEMQPKNPNSPRLHVKNYHCSKCGSNTRVAEKIPRQ